MYVEQFLYVDNTPGYVDGNIFSGNGLNEYIVKSADVFKRYAYGYGVWVYKDYCNNMLYNPQFALDTKGWEVTGKVSVENRDGSKAAKMSAGSELCQVIPVWRASVGMADIYEFVMDCNAKDSGNITVRIGTQVQTVEVNGNEKVSLQFEREDDMSLRIETGCEVFIDNVKLYNFVQSQELYDMAGQELSCIESVRELNAALCE